MAPLLLSLVCGLLFGAGLTISQMVNPAKVIAFLDFGGIESGAWDPSLAFVMVGAVAVTALGYLFARRRGRPFWGARLEIPTRKDVDGRLLLGASLFGSGWGLVGFCPGPAIAALLLDGLSVLVFVIAMGVGMFGFELFGGRARLKAAS